MALVAHYLMNDNAANTTVADTTTSHNGVAARNTDQFDTTGKINGALLFNGTTDLVTVSGDIMPSGDTTITFWCRLTGWGGAGGGRILDTYNAASKFALWMSTGGQISLTRNGATNIAYGVGISLATTHFVAITITANYATIYIDGKGAGGGVCGALAAGGDTVIGNRSLADRGFDGWIDDLRIYNDLKTLEDLVAIYNHGSGTELDAPALTLPAAANVATGSGTYGYTGSDLTPSYPTTATTQAADAATLETDKAYLLATKTITFGASSVTGTMAVASVLEAVTGGTYHAPDAAEVISTAVFGPSSGTAGTYDVSDVAGGNIIVGASIGGVAGTVDVAALEAAAAAAQLVTDKAAVAAAVAGILSTVTILTHTGTYHEATVGEVQDGVMFGPASAYEGTYDPITGAYTDPGKAYVVVGHDYTFAGVSQVAEYPTTATSQAAQLATDQAAVSAAAENIDGGVTIIGVEGTGLNATTLLTAIGLATGNLDTQLADIPTVAEMNARTKLAADYADKTTLDTIAVDVAGLDGAAMRGTDGAYTGTPPTASDIATAVWSSATRTLTSLSALVASIATAVWAATTRTLSGTSGANAPTAATNDADIYTTAFKGGTARLCARVYLNGTDVTQAAVSSITYSIYLLDEDDPESRTAVTGHSAVDLTVADVVYDTLQTDSQASNYNFRHTPPISTSAAFATLGDYLVEYTVTPATGETIIVRFVVKVE